MNTTTVPVLIVGGGGAGLSASMLLSSYGVESLLISALPSTSILPKAHVLGQRTMEIFTEVGVADEIYRRGTPQQNLVSTGFYAGVNGSHPLAGREIGKLETWGAGNRDPEYIDASPCPTTNLPQIRLEPVLKAHADKLNPGGIRFNHELVALEQDDNEVRSTIRDKATGAEYVVHSQYVIAADGGRTVGRFEGHVGVRDYVERFFVGYHTVTRLLSVEPLQAGRTRARVDFTGDFGHEIGRLDLTIGPDGLIRRIDADLE